MKFLILSAVLLSVPIQAQVGFGSGSPGSLNSGVGNNSSSTAIPAPSTFGTLNQGQGPVGAGSINTAPTSLPSDNATSDTFNSSLINDQNRRQAQEDINTNAFPSNPSSQSAGPSGSPTTTPDGSGTTLTNPK